MIELASIPAMTTEEKLRLMEALWSDLSTNPQDLPPPAWHEKALAEVDERLKKGEEELMDWEEAKKLLRNRFQ